jgi:hypothetical protein
LPDGGNINQIVPEPTTRAGIFETCANPQCRTGWLHLWRSRTRPLFEGRWSCSAECSEALIHDAILRELHGRVIVQPPHRHKIPIGLLMLNQGWITSEQLRQALDAQRRAGSGRLGSWLMRLFGVSEELVTRALALQWNAPVLHLDSFLPGRMARALPRLFVDAFGALPLRVAGGRILYLAFEERIDTILALALARMTGLKVECGVLPGSEFQVAHKKMLAAEFPRVQLLEAAGETALSRALARQFERARPAEARLIRVHDCLWLRLWKRRASAPLGPSEEVEDLIASVRI